MTPSSETPDINNLVDAEARIAARQAEIAKLTAQNDAALGFEPHYIAEDRAIRERRNQTLREISERYDNQPSLIRRFIDRVLNNVN